MDVLTPEQRSRNMKAIRSKGTKIETLLMKALWKAGYRYRKDNRKIFGKPDITFRTAKVAVFCDGEFFHGKDWEVQRARDCPFKGPVPVSIYDHLPTRFCPANCPEN